MEHLKERWINYQFGMYRLDDNDFEEHVNDLNSYGYSGSVPYQNLWVRLNWDYPQNMYSISGSVWVNNESPYYNIPNYYTGSKH